MHENQHQIASLLKIFLIRRSAIDSSLANKLAIQKAKLFTKTSHDLERNSLKEQQREKKKK